MPVTFSQVNSVVLEMASEVIDTYHLDLKHAKVGFVFQDEASRQDGRVILGNACKVSPKQKAAGLDLDFIITLAKDEFETRTRTQRMAIIDHELCHCTLDEVMTPKMVPHDIDEFGVVIERWGLYKDDLRRIAPCFTQPSLFSLEPQGAVVAVKPAEMEE